MKKNQSNWLEIKFNFQQEQGSEPTLLWNDVPFRTLQLVFEIEFVVLLGDEECCAGDGCNNWRLSDLPFGAFFNVTKLNHKGFKVASKCIITKAIKAEVDWSVTILPSL